MSRRVWAVSTAAVAVLIAFALAFALAPDGDDAEAESSRRAGTPSADDRARGAGADGSAVSATPSPAPLPADADPDVRVEQLVDETARVLAAPTGVDDSTLDRLATIARDSALGEVRAALQEYEANGWRQKGRPRLVDVTVGRLRKNGTVVMVRACVDSSRMKLLDEGGNDLLAGKSADRALNVYRLEREGTSAPWLVVAHRFPDDASC
ncbi:hypothetical protein KV100_13970 [Mumia sp. zg.B21]|uniref:hypothetical protein n=1 Tax=Mumia sp. zg.B21 TaxID=2855447 RepID=UPI001C6DD6C4|nr:hypothetical protein [Mumia sp. zg.B21]MBW9210762.1 hypothetical protein [Mumia sp. zg.B21]